MKRRLSLTTASLVALALVLVGAWMLGSHISGHRNDYGYVPNCGSAIAPILPSGGGAAPVYAQDCAQLQDERRQLAIPLVALGGMALAASGWAILHSRIQSG